MDIDSDAFITKFAQLTISEESTWRACHLCQFQSTLQTCHFILISPRYWLPQETLRDSKKKKEIKFAGGMLSKAYSSTWLSIDSVCGVRGKDVSTCPSAMLYLTLTLSWNAFLSTLYLHLYLQKPNDTCISKSSTHTRTSLTLLPPYSSAVVLVNISWHLIIIYPYIVFMLALC